MAQGRGIPFGREIAGGAVLLGALALAAATLAGRLEEGLPPILGLSLSSFLVVLSFWFLRPQRLLGRRTPELDWDQFWGASLAVGAGCLLAVVSVADLHDEHFESPRWVVTVAGAIFALFGALGMRSAIYGAEAEREGDLLTGSLVTLVLTGFGAVFSFAAFGPGERHFEGGLSIPFLSVDFLSGETAGRIAFGAAAVVLDLLALMGWALVIGSALRRRR